MSRSLHQFRPDTLEAFETRIVPTVTALTAPVFIPPGQYGPISHFPADITPDAKVFNVAGDTISIHLTNSGNTDRLETVAIYTAPGGGKPGTSGGNLASQRLAYSETVLVKAHTAHQLVTVDIQALIDSDELKLIGDDHFQCDIFDYPDKPGYAPEKLDVSDLDQDASLVVGELFDYEAPPKGKK